MDGVMVGAAELKPVSDAVGAGRENPVLPQTRPRPAPTMPSPKAPLPLQTTRPIPNRRMGAPPSRPLRAQPPLTFPTGQTFTWRSTAPSARTSSPSATTLPPPPSPSSSTTPTIQSPTTAPSPSYAGSSTSTSPSPASGTPSLPPTLASRPSRLTSPAPACCGRTPWSASSSSSVLSTTTLPASPKMVANLSSLGGFLGSVGAFDFFEFPSLERLELVSEQELRQSGFGYRAKYIVGSVKALQGKPGEVHIGLLPRGNWRFPR